MGAVVHFLLGDYAGVAERQAMLLELGARDDLDVRPAVTGLSAARRAGNDDALRAWQAGLSSRGNASGPGLAAALRFAAGLIAWREGRMAEATTDLAAATDFLGAQHYRIAWWFANQEQAAQLAASGQAAAAATVLRSQLEYWRKLKADWYLAQLKVWADENGFPLDAQ